MFEVPLRDRPPGQQDAREPTGLRPPAIQAASVSHHFGGVAALEDVEIAVAPGECHAVVGENGAGKSTLMRILAGILAPASGTVRVDGQVTSTPERAVASPRVALVHQELSLVPQLSVADNICLGSPPTRAGFVCAAEQKRIAEEALERVGFDVDPNRLVGSLPMASRQFVEIARALRRNPSVLILDEPSATLTPRETGRLIDLLRDLATGGVSVIYISHRLPEVFSLCERITVLRDGRLVSTVASADTTPHDLADLMVGRELKDDLRRDRERPAPGPVVLEARGIHAPGVRGADIQVRSGEIVGIGGLVGAGRTELLRALVGLVSRSQGTVVLHQGTKKRRIETYRAAVRHGVAFVPEERREEGLCLEWSVADNLLLASPQRATRFGLRSSRRGRRVALDLIGRLGVRPARPGLAVGNLSGGNQQKVAFGKWMAKQLDLLVLDEPTRGVDVGAKAEIHELIRKFSTTGAGVLLVSSDLPELLSVADRIGVMRDGRITGWLSGEDATEQAVMKLAVGTAALDTERS